MKKKFSSLPMGAKFYPPDGMGQANLRLKLIKVYPIKLKLGAEGEAMAITPNVVSSEGLINCVIDEGPPDLMGYFDYTPENFEVYDISKENTLIC